MLIMCNGKISQVPKQEETGALQPKLINASFGLCSNDKICLGYLVSVSFYTNINRAESTVLNRGSYNDNDNE